MATRAQPFACIRAQNPSRMIQILHRRFGVQSVKKRRLGSATIKSSRYKHTAQNQRKQRQMKKKEVEFKGRRLRLEGERERERREENERDAGGYMAASQLWLHVLCSLSFVIQTSYSTQHITRSKLVSTAMHHHNTTGSEGLWTR